MAATTFEALQNEADTPGFIRKMGVGLGFLAPMDVTLPDTITDATTGEVNELPTGWLSVGIVNPDGYTFGTEAEEEDVEAFSYVTPPRSDLTSIARTVQFSPYELHKRHMTELQVGADLTAIEQTVSGEIVFDEPNIPLYREYRFLVIGADGPADNQWVLGLGFPRVKMSTQDSLQWAKEGALTRAITLKVFTDDELGTPTRHYIGGTGAKAASAELGWTQAGV